MIELKGIYHNNRKQNPLAILAQYDGQLLHVWHLTDPFYRLRSGSRFSIQPSKTKTEKIIKFPDGDYIETGDLIALDQLTDGIRHYKSLKMKGFFNKGKIIGIAAIVILLIWVGLSLRM